jgi:hypothetical protein
MKYVFVVHWYDFRLKSKEDTVRNTLLNTSWWYHLVLWTDYFRLSLQFLRMALIWGIMGKCVHARITGVPSRYPAYLQLLNIHNRIVIFLETPLLKVQTQLFNILTTSKYTKQFAHGGSGEICILSQASTYRRHTFTSFHSEVIKSHL